MTTLDSPKSNRVPLLISEDEFAEAILGDLYNDLGPIRKKRVARGLIERAGIQPINIDGSGKLYVPRKYLDLDISAELLCPLKPSKEVKSGMSGALSKVRKSMSQRDTRIEFKQTLAESNANASYMKAQGLTQNAQLSQMPPFST